MLFFIYDLRNSLLDLGFDVFEEGEEYLFPIRLDLDLSRFDELDPGIRGIEDRGEDLELLLFRFSSDIAEKLIEDLRELSFIRFDDDVVDILHDLLILLIVHSRWLVLIGRFS